MGKYNFSIDNIFEFRKDDNPELALAKVNILSTRENSHKINITEEILKRDTPSILGKFMVGELDWLGNDVTKHTHNQVIFGYYPKEQTIEFNKNEFGDIVASAYVVISKLYAYNFYKIFTKDNLRNVSVEMQTYGDVKNEDGSITIGGFNLCATTCLGKTVNGSCPDANMTMVRFSEDEADKYYRSKIIEDSILSKFVKNREEKEYVDHPIDESKDSIYDGEWDGNKEKHNLIWEKQYKTLAPKVCLLLEDGWEDRKIDSLKYPVMGLYDGKWRYSRKGLASAKAYAEQENNEDVLSKVATIYKNLGLVGGTMEDKKLSIEELEAKIADFEAKCAELEEKCENLELECQKYKEECEANEAMVAEKDEIITAQTETLAELENFKSEKLEEEKVEKVNAVLAQIKDKVDEADYEAIVEKFADCTIETFDGIRNQVFAELGEKLLAKKEVVEDTTKLEMKFDTKKTEPKGLWDTWC